MSKKQLTKVKKPHKKWRGFVNFLAKFKAVWIICGIVLCFCAVDFANYTTYSLQISKVYTEDNPEGDLKKLYFSTSDKQETIYFRVKITSGDLPCANHTLVAVGKKSGLITEARQVTNANGEATFTFVPNTVFRMDTIEVESSVLFYDESTAWIIEFRVENLFNTPLYRRP